MSTITEPEIRLFWKPGCSNCVRLKEHVSKRGFAFTEVNVQDDPGGFAELEHRGIRGIPVITRGDRYAFGMNLDDVDDLLGVRQADHQMLSPAELVERAISVTDAAMRFGYQLPKARYFDNVPGRKRSYLSLVNHVVGHLSRFVMVVDRPDLDYSDINVYALAGYQTVEDDLLEDGITIDDIVAKAEPLKASARAWLESGGDPERQLKIFYGLVNVHHVLESNTYSIVQHTRQLQAVIRYLGFEPDGAIGNEEYRGLRLPAALWDEVD